MSERETNPARAAACAAVHAGYGHYHGFKMDTQPICERVAAAIEQAVKGEEYVHGLTRAELEHADERIHALEADNRRLTDAIRVEVLADGHSEDWPLCVSALALHDRAHPAAGEQEGRCEMCGKPATCFGSYYGHVEGYGCDDCCGHACEDGECKPLGEPAEQKARCVCHTNEHCALTCGVFHHNGCSKGAAFAAADQRGPACGIYCDREYGHKGECSLSGEPADQGARLCSEHGYVMPCPIHTRPGCDDAVDQGPGSEDPLAVLRDLCRWLDADDYPIQGADEIMQRAYRLLQRPPIAEGARDSDDQPAAQEQTELDASQPQDQEQQQTPIPPHEYTESELSGCGYCNKPRAQHPTKEQQQQPPHLGHCGNPEHWPNHRTQTEADDCKAQEPLRCAVCGESSYPQHDSWEHDKAQEPRGAQAARPKLERGDKP